VNEVAKPMIGNRATRRRGAKRRIGIIPLLVCFALTPFSLQADWINLTGAETAPNIAEITVFDDRVEVALEVYIGDIGTFDALRQSGDIIFQFYANQFL
jgi:hypothetical protein